MVVAVVVAYWAHEMPSHLRLSVLLYCVLFVAVGQPFNDYWGFLTAPIITLWLAYTPQGLRALLANTGLTYRPGQRQSGEPLSVGTR